jgi:hypothetical protein
MTPQSPKSRQLSSRSVDTLKLEKDELVAYIRERRAYMVAQEKLINEVINNGNNQILQLTLESDTLKLEIVALRKEKIQLTAYRDDIMYNLAISQNV